MNDNIMRNLKIAIICIILVALMQLFYCFLNFTGGAHQNLKVYIFSCIGIGLYSLRQIRKYECENK